jgi:hypothetical protein
MYASLFIEEPLNRRDTVKLDSIQHIDGVLTIDYCYCRASFNKFHMYYHDPLGYIR